MLNLNLSPQRPDLLFLTYVQQRNVRLLDAVYRSAPNNRLLGCLIGLAVGDVLGCPVEGMTFQEINQRYGYVKSLLTPAYWKNWRLAGLHSDDTQQALVLIDAIALVLKQYGTLKNNYELLAETIAQTYIKGLQYQNGTFGCWRGTGSGFRTVVKKLEQNRTQKQAYLNQGEASAGIGAVMRIPALGIVAAKKEDLYDLSYYCTVITHTDPTALISAYLIAYACFLLKTESPATFDKLFFLKELYQEAKLVENQPDLLKIPMTNIPKINSILLKTLIDSKASTPATAMNLLKQETSQFLGKPTIPTAGYAPSGMAASLYFFINNYTNAEQAILSGINAGWDTDSIGAIVGGLAGSLCGTSVCERLAPTLVALDLIVAKVNNLDPFINPIRDIDLIKEEILLTTLEDNLKNTLLKLK